MLRENKEIEDMRDDIIKTLKTSAANANQYVTKFNKYEHLWTTDREQYLQQFLLYGRGLTNDEQQLISSGIEIKLKENKPTLDSFREEVKLLLLLFHIQLVTFSLIDG